jgi:membrane-bound serine protease (ClpP class)
MILVPPGAKDPSHQNEPQLRPEFSGYPRTGLDGDRSLVGRSGVALTILRPAGKARIDDRMIDVVSDGPFIEQGAAVVVLEVLGNRVVVRKA